MKPCIVATRRSPLALAQSRLVVAQFQRTLGLECELLEVMTTGDRKTQWDLQEKGGKGLFTGELEQHLRQRSADIAVHSTKDLPGDLPGDLAIAGYLPRGDARDVLVTRTGIITPKTVATSSPRRRLQLMRMLPAATFTVIRGNVDTRLRKIAEGAAEATVLAAAGLARLGIATWPGLDFHWLDPKKMVPAVGQGAIAVQSRARDTGNYAAALDSVTARHVNLERALQAALGSGCNTAFGAYAGDGTLYFFHEQTGAHQLPLSPDDLNAPVATAQRVLQALGLG
ncbi:MAG: hydroxymethylbilane synthase [Lacunisphaera sp.]